MDADGSSESRREGGRARGARRPVFGGKGLRRRFAGGAAAVAVVVVPAAASAATTGAATLAASGAAGGRTSVFQAFFIQRHPDTGELELLGTGIIWLLLALSAACVGLIVSVAVSTTKAKTMPDGLYRTVRDRLRKRDTEGALRAVETDSSYFAAVVAAALYDAEAGFSAMIRALEQTSEELTVRRLRRVEPLNVIGNVAPMIGLFGTVYGMILAFREIVAAGGSPDPVGLAQGIGTALTTTFWGLVVAIPALAGYAFLRNRIDALTLGATRDAEELINRFRPTLAGGAARGPASDGNEASADSVAGSGEGG